jgi:hypothetical protein
LSLLRAALALALVAAIPWLQARIDARRVPRQQENVLYLWSGEHLRRMLPGLENVMADVYWLRTVQYFGNKRLFARDKSFALLGPLTDITTTLDPRFYVAYKFGAIFLSEPWPLGAGDAERAIALLERGCRHVPNPWRLRQEIGFIQYLFLKDHALAARTILDAMKIPGAPFWLESLAAGFMAESDRDASRRIWRNIQENSEFDQFRNVALNNLQRLDALDMVDALNARVREFEQARGRKPGGVEDLRAAGIMEQRLVDPTGAPFMYDPQRGEFAIAQSSRLWRKEP